MKMTFSPVRGLIVLLLFSCADAGKLQNLLFCFFAFTARVNFEFEDNQEAESPEISALSAFVSHCVTDGPQWSDWAGSGCLNSFKSCRFSFMTAGRGLWKIQERVRSVQLQKAKQLLLMQTGCQAFRHVKEGKIQQPLDHFNPQDLRTFPQVENESQTCPLNLVETL